MHILVTGAARGLGREIAIALSRAGHRVVLNYHRSGKKALELAKSLNGAIAVKADVGDLRQVMAMEKALREGWGRLDALINNAGIAKDSLLIKTTEEDWDSVIRTNLTGCFNTIRTFAPLMAESGGGHIINISSYSGLKGKEGQAAYSASKSALLGLTVSTARELAEFNIRVNAVLPGYMPTEMGMQAKEAMEKAREMSVLGRLSEPKEVAGFISYLITTEGITGQVFSLDSRI